jgi:hypothetical protein
MKKIIAFLAILATSGGAMAQNKTELNEAFGHFANRKDAFSLTLNKKMMDAVDLDFDWKEEVKHVSGDIHQLKFIVFSEEDSGMMIAKKFSSEITKAGYPKINLDLEDEEIDTDIKYFKIFGKKINGAYEDVHVLTVDSHNRAYFFSINGKLKIKNAA